MSPQRQGLGSAPIIAAALAFALGLNAPQLWGLWLCVLGAGILRPLRGLFALGLLFFAVGYGSAQLRSALPKPRPPRGDLVIEGWVEQAPALKADRRNQRIRLDAAGPWGHRLGAQKGALWLQTLSDCGAPGDRIRVWARLFEPKPAGAPGTFDQAAYFETQGLSARARALSPCLILERDALGGLRIAMERVRHRLHQRIEARLGPRAPIVRAFATGDASGLPAELRRAYVRSGLMHLLAVSGLNLAILSGLFCVLLHAALRRSTWVSLRWGARRTAAALALPFVGLYALLVGASPSAVRAACMVAAVLSAELLGRRAYAPGALALAAMAMMAHDPQVLHDPSFQLSAGAVAALLGLLPAMQKRWGFRGAAFPLRAAWDVVLATIAATVGTAPLVALHFGRISIAGLWANLPAAPLSSFVLVPLSLLGAALELPGRGWGRWPLELAAWAGEALNALARWAGESPGASLPVPAPSLAQVGAGLLAMMLWRWSPAPFAWRRVRRRAGAAVVLSLTLSIVVPIAQASLRKDLRMTVLPVGQGDATVLELPGGKTAMVDCGPVGAGAFTILPFLRARGIRSLDLVVLTHPHADHIGGLAAIAQEMPIRELWWNGDTREALPALLAPIAKLPAEVVKAGTRRSFGPAELELLGPLRPVLDYEVINDGSLVLQVRLGERRLLLTGDAEAQAEAEMAWVYQRDLRSDVLKAGHHGSRSSSTEPLLQWVQPAHAILSLGAKNHFGFPHPQAVKRLAPARLWRTDAQGAITVWTDGRALELSAFVR